MTPSGGEHERSLCCDAPHLIVMTGWSCLQCGNVTLQLTLQILQCQLQCGLQCLGSPVCIVVDGFRGRQRDPLAGVHVSRWVSTVVAASRIDAGGMTFGPDPITVEI